MRRPPDRTGRRPVVRAAVTLLAAVIVAGPAAAQTGTASTASPNVAANSRAPAELIEDFEAPSLAIDPMDPDNLVVAYRRTQPDYHCYAAHSTDGGRSWTSSDLPLPPAGTCWSPGVAFGPDGDVHLATQNRPPGGGAQNIIVYSSGDGGATFDEPVAIPGGAGFEASIAVDVSPASPHTGRIHVTWYNFPNYPVSIDVLLAHSDDGGATWSTPASSTIPGQHQYLPSVAVAPDGTVYIVYKDIAGCPGGQGVGGTAASSPSQCAIWVTRSSDGGDTLDQNVMVDLATFKDLVAGEAPGIATAPNGDVLVTWAAQPDPPTPGDEPHTDPDCPTSDYDVFVARSSDRGESWQQAAVPNSNGTVNDDPCEAGSEQFQPWIDVAPSGRVDVVFYDTRNDPDNVLMDLYHTTSTDGGMSFTPNRRVTDRSFDRRRMFTPKAAGFQSTEFDEMTAVVATDDVAIAAWGDARNTLPTSPSGDADTATTDVFTSRITIGGVAPPAAVSSLAGVDPFASAVAVSQATHSFAETVVVASVDRFAEALVAAPLARLGRGPTLLTERDQLPRVTSEEITRLSPSLAYVVGGSDVVTDGVIAELEALGVPTVTRVGGDDQYATAAMVAAEVDYADGTAVLVSGELADESIAAGTYAAFTRTPILLVTRDGIPRATRDALDDNAVTTTLVVGSTTSIRDAVIDELDTGGYGPVRIAGASPHATSVAVAELGRSATTPVPVNVVYAATARSWHAAATAAPAIAYRGGTLLLADAEAVSSGFLSALRREIDQVVQIGCGRIADTTGYAVVPASPTGCPNPVAPPDLDPDPDPDVDRVIRLGGDDRVATAIAISRDGFADGSAATVVLARADDFADALSGTPLAVREAGPLLLTDRDRLLPDTEAELERVLPRGRTVTLVGGEDALAGSVSDRLRDLGYEIRRIAGDTRVDTAIAVARALGDPATLMIATGDDFADAVTAAAAAAHVDAAVLLTPSEQRAAAVDEYLAGRDPARLFAVGGPAARPYPEATGLVGDTRVQTAILVADQFFDQPPAVGLARDDRFPDALAGGGHVAVRGGPVLLTPSDTLHPDVASWLCTNADAVATAYVYGGSLAISPATSDAVAGRIVRDGCG